MLVLSRKHGEAIRIHEQVTITVLGIRGNRVQLGIEAPAGVAIRRRELDDGYSGQSPAAESAALLPAHGRSTGAF